MAMPDRIASGIQTVIVIRGEQPLGATSRLAAMELLRTYIVLGIVEARRRIGLGWGHDDRGCCIGRQDAFNIFPGSSRKGRKA